MRRIQAVALDLFEQHGYAQVTIERIAAEAEVSPSSIYRYFGTKEQIALWDEYDPLLITQLREELRHHPPLAAAKRAMAVSVARMAEQGDIPLNRRRLRLLFEEPQIESAAAVMTLKLADLLGEMMAGGADDLDAQMLAHGIVGAAMGAIRHWYRTGFTTPLAEITDRLFASFETGFPASTRRPPAQ